MAHSSEKIEISFDTLALGSYTLDQSSYTQKPFLNMTQANPDDQTSVASEDDSSIISATPKYDKSYHPTADFSFYSPPKQRRYWGEKHVLPRINWVSRIVWKELFFFFSILPTRSDFIICSFAHRRGICSLTSFM